jgi:hypothetical protein
LPDDDSTVLFGLGTDEQSGDARITMLGDFVPGSLNTAQAFSDNGINDLSARLGLLGGGDGGYIAAVAPVAKLTGTTEALVGSIESAGEDISLNLYFTDNLSGFDSGGHTASNWTVKWQINIDSGGWGDVSGATWTVGGDYSEEEHSQLPGEYNWHHFLNMTRLFVYTSTPGEEYEFRISFVKNSGEVYNSILQSANANEPSGLDFSPGNKFGMFRGVSNTTMANSTTWKTMDLTTEVYDPDDNYTIASDIITILDPGYYEISYNYNFHGTGGATNDSIGCRILKNGSQALVGSENRTYFAKSNTRPSSCTATFVHLFIANDTIRLQQNDESGTSGAMLASITTLSIKKLRGP